MKRSSQLDVRAFLPGVLLVLVMAQPNMATGMMPFYRDRWDLAPLVITVVFSAYLFALVPTLVRAGRPAERDGWWWRITAGAGCSVAADLTMSFADSAATACVARVAAGISVGLVTGSLAGLILERLGESGRTAVASATVGGSALGTMGAALLAQFLPAPGQFAYFVHAAGLVLVAVPVCLRRGTPAALAAPPIPTATECSTPSSRTVGYLSGISAWVSAGLVVALVPAYAGDLLHTANLAVTALPVTLYLVCAWVAQRIVPASRVVTGQSLVAQAAIVGGIAIIATVAAIPQLAVLVIGAAAAGSGQGVAYRAGLRLVSAGTPPALHARMASRYAATAYSFAAVFTIIFGYLATAFTMTAAVGAALLTLSGIGTATLIATRIRTDTLANTSAPRTNEAIGN